MEKKKIGEAARRYVRNGGSDHCRGCLDNANVRCAFNEGVEAAFIAGAEWFRNEASGEKSRPETGLGGKNDKRKDFARCAGNGKA